MRMKRYRKVRVVALFIVCIMIFSLWNPLIFASSKDTHSQSTGQNIESNATPEGVKNDKEVLLDSNAAAEDKSKASDKETEPAIKQEEVPRNQEDPSDPQEKEEKTEGTSIDQGKNTESEGTSHIGEESIEPKDSSKEEGNSPQDEDLVLEEEPEKTISYYPASSPLRVGPIIQSFGLLKSSGKMSSLHSDIIGDYVKPLEGLNLTKNATVFKNTHDGRQIFQLDLTATTESKIVDKTKPSDIVLVLDRSGSMTETLENIYTEITNAPDTSKTYYIKINGSYQSINYNYGGWYYGSSSNRKFVSWDKNGDDSSPGSDGVREWIIWPILDRWVAPDNPIGKPFYTRTEVTRLQSLKDAANHFVHTVSQESPDSKIAVVSFSGETTNHTSGLVNVKNGGSVNSTITNAINGLTAEGATHSNKGLGLAKNIFQGDNTTDRNRVVIMFTDGEPGNQGFGNTTGYRYAAAAINQAAVLKGQRGRTISSDVGFNGNRANGSVDLPRTANNESGCGATLYTIGVFPSNVSNHVHRYMAWVSSDNDSSQTATNPDGYEYYFTAEDADSLNNIFQKIAEETGKTIKDVAIRDYIDPRFHIVDANGNRLGVGAKVDGGAGTIKSDNNILYVEWVKEKIEPGTLEEGKGFKGTLYLRPKEDFVGGNNVPTNVPNISAIYSGDQNIGSFPYPLVNVPFTLNIKDINDTLFLGESMPRSQNEARDEMVAESLDNVSYPYPSEMLNIHWNENFTKDTKPRDTTTYTLTVTATPKDYIQNPNKDFYHTAVGTRATEISKTGTYGIDVKKGTLTITKTIEGTENPNQSFVFEIKQYEDIGKTKLAKTFYETIRVINGSNGRKIINLPKGYYEVTEKNDWSWQYDAVGNRAANDTLGMDEKGNRNINKINGETSFTNKAKEIKWLTSIDWVINKFKEGGN